MKSYNLKIEIDAPAEEVLKLVTTAEWAETEALADGSITAKARVEKSDGKSVTLVIEREDPSRGPKGIKMKDKKEKSVLTSEWDLGSMRSKWSVRTIGMEKIVKVSGSTWIEPAGNDKWGLGENGPISADILPGDIRGRPRVARTLFRRWR